MACNIIIFFGYDYFSTMAGTGGRACAVLCALAGERVRACAQASGRVRACALAGERVRCAGGRSRRGGRADAQGGAAPRRG
jgi:hypothetical protein